MQVDLSAIETATRLASQYGPFLFAILFIFVVTRTAHKYYQECNTRKVPATEEEKKTYRAYFLISVWGGIALTLMSIGWWVYVQMQGPSIYQIAIVGLHADEAILSQYFSKTVPRPTIAGASALTDEYFIVAQDRPFRMGDKFSFYYFKTEPAQPAPAGAASPPASVGVAGIPIEVQYTGNGSDTYQITQTGSTVSLTIVAGTGAASNTVLAHNRIEPIKPQAERVAEALADGSGRR